MGYWIILAGICWLALGAAAVPKAFRNMVGDYLLLFHAVIMVFILVAIFLLGPFGLLIVYGDTVVYRPKPPGQE